MTLIVKDRWGDKIEVAKDGIGAIISITEIDGNETTSEVQLDYHQLMELKDELDKLIGVEYE